MPQTEKDCKKEALALSNAIHLILTSDNYQELVAQFEGASEFDADDPATHPDTDPKKKKIKTMLEGMGVDPKIINKFMQGAFKKGSVSFKWW